MGWTGTPPNKTFTRTDGTYTGGTVYAQEKAAGIGIVETNLDATEYDMAQGINACLLKDGGNKPTALIDANGYGFTNLATLASANEAAIASSATTDVLGSSALFNAITGTTTITSLGSGANRLKFVRFTAALTLTHNPASLVLPGGVDIVTAAGDTMVIASDGSSNVRVLAYQSAGASLSSIAQNKLLGRVSSGTGLVEALSGTQATGLLDAVVGDAGSGGTKGLVPAPASGDAAAGKFLSAAGTFSVPTIASLIPQGRLTATSLTPVIAGDVSAATAVYYTPYVGNYVPIWNGAVFVVATFAELTLSLVANHAANTLYDVFVFLDGGAATLGTGPAWSNPGNYVSAGTLTTGTANRGTGAGTTELERKNGLLTNKVSMTARNGATTYTVGANQGTYVGTIWIDATAGQLTCHVSYGQNRKFGVWNAYNRMLTVMLGGESTASWNYTTATIRASNNSAANSITTLLGLPDERVEVSLDQRAACTTASVTLSLGIGVASTTTFSGQVAALDTGSSGLGGSYTARHSIMPFIGLQAVTALERGASGGSFRGTASDQRLSVLWHG